MTSQQPGQRESGPGVRITFWIQFVSPMLVVSWIQSYCKTFAEISIEPPFIREELATRHASLGTIAPYTVRHENHRPRSD